MLRSPILVFALCLTACGLSGLDDTEGDGEGQEAAPVTLTVGTYNVFLREPFLEGIAYDRSNPQCRAQMLGERLGELGLDILALQESFALNDVLVKGFQQTAGEENWAILGQPWPRPVGPGPGHYGCFDAAGDFHQRLNGFRVTNGGVSLFSPHPYAGTPWMDVGELTETVKPDFGPTARGYCACNGDDCLAFKGLSYAPVLVHRGADVVGMNVISTHLDAGSNAENAAVRLEQLRSIRAFIEERLCTHTERNRWPTLLVGDMNVNHRGGHDANEEYHTMMQELGNISCLHAPVDAYLEVHQSWPDTNANAGTSTCKSSTIETCSLDDVSRRLDYILMFNPRINPAYPRANGIWRIGAITQASTEALMDPSCAFENKGETLNASGHLSDHKLVTATIVLTRVP